MFLGFAQAVDTSLAAAASVADTEASAVVALTAVAQAVAALADAVASGASAVVAQAAVVLAVVALADAAASVAVAPPAVAGLERCSPVWGCCLFQAGLHRHHSLNRIGRRRREVLRIRYKSS